VNTRQSLIELHAVTARVRNRHLLPNTSWKIEAGCHWAIIGPNGAGKTTLAGILTGRVPLVKGHTVRNLSAAAIRSLSFETVDHLIAPKSGWMTPGTLPPDRMKPPPSGTSLPPA